MYYYYYYYYYSIVFIIIIIIISSFVWVPLLNKGTEQKKKTQTDFLKSG